MSEFSELVKRFDKIRTYVRDFYIYGFKTREDYQNKSARTYDNERRRIESWFSDYIQSDYNSERKKSVAITIDSSRISVNPLYSVWKSKSFTSNDIMLHFFILDLLQDGELRSVDEITDEIQINYQVLFDSQTVRKKLVEYEKSGLFTLYKEGKQNLYGVNPSVEEEIPEELPDLLNAVRFYQGISPFGFVGSTILDNQQTDNDLFRMKHDYLVHTLEDEILLPLLTAIKERKVVSLTIRGSKRGNVSEAIGTPLKILVSTQTGRRYVCLRNRRSCRFHAYRLDTIQSVSVGEAEPEFSRHMEGLLRNLSFCWGVSFGSKRNPEEVKLTLKINEETEQYILNRLEREGRHGTITRIGPGAYLYEVRVWDANELLPWVKTFTGRILSFECSNKQVETIWRRDMERMISLYLGEGDF